MKNNSKSSNTDSFIPAIDAAYYVLFRSMGALNHYPNIMKGEGQPEGVVRGLYVRPYPADEGQTYRYLTLPDWLAPKMRVLESLADKDEIEKMTSVSITVKPARARKLPDIFMTQVAILSGRAREVLEEYAPDLAYFFPAHLSNSKTKEPIEGPWWGCVPRIQFFTPLKPDFEFDPFLVSDTGTRILQQLHWVEGALEYVSDNFPLIRDSDAGLCMSPELFRVLNDAGLTGLTEIPANARELVNLRKRGDIYDHLKEFVGHVHWNRHGKFIK